jgi:glucose/arabinose dehydrogenase
MNNWYCGAAGRRWACWFVSVAAAFGFVNTAHAAVDVQLVASGLPYIVGIEHAGDASGRLFLVSQSGQIVIYDGTQVLPTPFLDLSSLVLFDGEQGLLGLAFHPSYTSNGLFFLNYINTSGQTVIARYRVSANPNVADPSSQTILLTENQPFANHNGGQLRFGPDGFLYIALGDGGSGGDPLNDGQRLDTILGKLLRIDVNSGSPYAIPPSNPFVSTPGARGEIWAYGLRNPWRFSFDRQTGDLFIADVGQNLWEEVDYQLGASHGGENYGWRLMEGRHCYNPSSECNNGSLTLPIVEYSHTLGCSVTGGFRYRGSLLTDLAGAYFFADYCSGRIWSAKQNPDGTWSATMQLRSSLTITTFGEDPNGELYVSDHGTNGHLYRLVPASSPSPLLTVTKIGVGTGRITTSPSALECGSICGARLASGTAVTLTATPDPGSTFVGWSGDPDCADGALSLSADRSCTASFQGVFTDDPIVPGSTVVKAVHVTELRSLINVLRRRFGLSEFVWTDPTIASTVVKAIHITEMRAALNEAFAAAGRAQPTYTDPALSVGNAVKAVHLTDLRSAVLALK